jgi:anaphase-promoting complex subunit 4
LPEVIKSWPNLLSDPASASMSCSQDHNQSTLDEVDDSNIDSVLAVADDLGNIHCFLDGSYPLGAIPLGTELSIQSLFKDPRRPVFFAYPRVSSNSITMTDVMPVVIRLPLLERREIRDLAKISSTARDLVWYTMRVVKEMRNVWFGSEGYSGARELGPKWIRALETKQKDQFGREFTSPLPRTERVRFYSEEEPNPMFDLTSLLVTGRVSESLQDFLGNGEQMTERVIIYQTIFLTIDVRCRGFRNGNRPLPKLS